MINLKRIKQVFRFGWMHAGEISEMHFAGKKRVSIFKDILLCFHRYGMWSNQYVKEHFWALSADERKTVGDTYQQTNAKKELWLKDFYTNKEFFIKYGSIKYERSLLREKRNKAYSERYNAGKNLQVEYDVNISRQHYLNGSILIGDNVLLGKHVFIDYTGNLIIKNNVRITNGVIIETHHHAYHSDPTVSKKNIVPTELIIEEGVVIGSRAIILPTCHYIGKYTRIGAGAVVTKDIPDNVIAAGVPAKVIRYLNSPEENHES